MADVPAALPARPTCEVAGLRIDGAFEQAGYAGCTIGGDGNPVIITVRPETTPINPSPWYAARLSQPMARARSLSIVYTDAPHRYAPWLSVNGGAWQQLHVTDATLDRKKVEVAIPAFAGSAIVAAQPIRPLAEVELQWSSYLQTGTVALLVQFVSRDGRPVPLFRHGPANAARIHFFAARQHPPETTGANAFDAFAETLLAMQPAARCPGHAFVFAPAINPDGIVRGHWRTNAGRVDPNRDWGLFGEPETAGVGQWLTNASTTAKIATVLDFHSTRRDALYTSKAGSIGARQFADAVGAATGFAVIATQAVDANTLKSWAEHRFGADAFTVELADASSPASAATAGTEMARLFLEHLACPAAGG